MIESEATEALQAREPIFHRPELGSSRAHFEAMTDEGFWEVGASGRVYDRDYVLDGLERRYATAHEDVWDVTEFCCRPLGGSVYLATYLLSQGSRRSRRATLWSFNGEWTALYHQGTVVSDAG